MQEITDDLTHQMVEVLTIGGWSNQLDRVIEAAVPIARHQGRLPAILRTVG